MVLNSRVCLCFSQRVTQGTQVYPEPKLGISGHLLDCFFHLIPSFLQDNLILSLASHALFFF